MPTVNIHAAKTHLSRLVEQAAAGEEVIIAKAGTPVAKLGPLALGERKKRRLGVLAGRMTVPADFDAPLPDDVLDLLEQGKEVVLTRNGKPLARLVPHTEHIDGAQVRAALARIRSRAHKTKGGFDWETVKGDRDAGRR